MEGEVEMRFAALGKLATTTLKRWASRAPIGHRSEQVRPSRNTAMLRRRQVARHALYLAWKTMLFNRHHGLILELELLISRC